MKTVALSSVLLCLAFASVAFCQNTKKRDLSVYDDGGTTDFGWGYMTDHKIHEARLRDFIWTHFNEKSRGHIRAAFYSIEGDPTYDHIFIEPDAKGAWQISIESEQHCCWTYALEKPRKRRTVRKGTEVYYTAERTKVALSGIGRNPELAELDRLAADDTTPSRKYRLVLKRTTSSDIVRNF